MGIDPASGLQPELALYPEDLAAVGRRIQVAVADLPAALHRFTVDGFPNVADFGSTAQDQQVGRNYQNLCETVQELLPMTQDGIDNLGATVQRWAAIFADHDAATAQTLANQANGLPR
jgi:hypothetical protein